MKIAKNKNYKDFIAFIPFVNMYIARVKGEPIKTFTFGWLIWSVTIVLG